MRFGSAGASTAIAVVIATMGGAVCAQDNGERYRECYEGGMADRVIAACSVVIGDRTGDKQDIAAAFKSRGDAHDDKGEYELALDDYAEALALSPQDPEALNSRGASHMSTGRNAPRRHQRRRSGRRRSTPVGGIAGVRAPRSSVSIARRIIVKARRASGSLVGRHGPACPMR